MSKNFLKFYFHPMCDMIDSKKYLFENNLNERIFTVTMT